MAQSRNVLTIFINGIVATKSTHTQQAAKKTRRRQSDQPREETQPLVPERAGHLHKVIHRGDRCNLSLFQLGLDLLDYFESEGKHIPVDFKPYRACLPIKSAR